MAITTSKNQIFIIVCHLLLDSEKKKSFFSMNCEQKAANPTDSHKVFSLAKNIP